MTLSLELEKSITPVLERMGVSLVLGTFQREGGGRVLRLFIERADADPDTGSGVDLGLCAEVSREVGYALDVSDAIDEAYRLEVSSPGIERPLVRPEDYSRFKGRKARIVTREAVEGKRKFEGMLLGFEDGAVSIELGEDKRVLLIPNEIIKTANLVFEDKV